MDLSKNISSDQLRQIFKIFNRFMLLLWRLGLGSYGNGTRYGGSIMVLKTTGRKTGLVRHTPLNYAVHEGDIYCTAGFGYAADWYRNVLANPQVEVWLPEGRWSGTASDVSDTGQRVELLRRVIVASGFAAYMFGVNPAQLSDQDIEQMLASYRLVRIQPTQPMTGIGGPGDLAWVWPLSTTVLLGLVLVLLRKKRR